MNNPLRTLKKSSRRRIIKRYTTAKPIFGAAIAVIGLIVTLLINAAPGVLMLILGIVLFVASAMVWVFDKDAGEAARGLYWLNYYLPLWQCELSEIGAVEIKQLPPIDSTQVQHPDDSRTTLVLKNGERRPLWGEHSDRSREVAKFLNIRLVELKAE